MFRFMRTDYKLGIPSELNFLQFKVFLTVKETFEINFQ